MKKSRLALIVFLALPATPQANRYTGAAKCATCHASQSAHFHENSMSRALEPIETCAILKGDIHYTFTTGPYTWSIARIAGKVVYKVTDGKETFETPLEYAFGQGKAGQTYVFPIDGRFYESRVSYYAKLNNLDLTVGAMNSKPANLREAAGRAMEGNEPRACFGCHTTGARTASGFQLDHFEAGVQCEACHGPGGAHIDSIKDGKPAPKSIRSLKGMGPQEANEFCGACHRTWENVMMMGIKGINNARFPAYRLTNSQCFSLDDPRIACTACHNPHGPLIADDKAYDAKCNACHDTAKRCPVAKESCATCHMPRIETKESHHAFPDHWIRVVHANDDYPN